MRSIALSVERPDCEVNIDFLSFRSQGANVEGVNVKVQLNYNPQTQEATLYVYAIDSATAQILFDDVRPVTVELLDKCQMDEEDS